MDSFFKMVDVQTVLFIYMAVGFFCRKKGIFNDAARDKLTDFVVLITLPCMIFESFHMELSLESLKQGGVAVLIATAMAGIALLLGKVLYNRFPYQEKSILQYGTLVSNSGFAGLPVVSGAYGDEGLFLGSLFIIPTRILMWSAGISLFTKADAKQAVRKVLLNPGIIAVEVGLVWMLFQLPLPHFVDAAVDNLGACTSPMAMALVGAILADVPSRPCSTPSASIWWRCASSCCPPCASWPCGCWGWIPSPPGSAWCSPACPSAPPPPSWPRNTGRTPSSPPSVCLSRR